MFQENNNNKLKHCQYKIIVLVCVQSKNVHSQTSKNVQNLNSHVKQFFDWMEHRSLILFSLFTEVMSDQVFELWLIIFSEQSGMLINGDT